jgi:transcriptional pleiotropic regulator of transition state genes
MFAQSNERQWTMSDTGIVRRVDDLGRIVLPMELRRTLGINVKDPMSISVDGERIIVDDIVRVRDRAVCRGCVATVKAVAV